jgi:hypothetical protein
VRIIWRDDDVLFHRHRLPELLALDDIFQRYGCLHTVAIIAETLTPELGAIIRERGMSAQLHCWSHDDLSVDETAIAQLPAAVAKIEDMVGARPTILYPPWNRTSQALEAAAAALGLTVSWQKISLEQYIRANGDVSETVCNFHYWNEGDAKLIEPALKIATA